MNSTKTAAKSNSSLYLVVLGMWVLFFHEVLKSFAITEMIVAYSGYFILFAALLIELKKGALSFVTAKYRRWLLAIWFFSCFALLYGAAKSHDLQFLSRDIWPYAFFACLLLAARTPRWVVIDRMIYMQFIIGLGIFIYIWWTLDISFQREVIARNTLSWDQPRVYWAWGLLYGWQYMFLAYNAENNMFRKFITIMGISLFVVFGMIMSKRQLVFDLFLIIFLKQFFEAKISNYAKSKLIRNALVIITIGVLSTITLGVFEKKENISYTESLFLRSTQSGSLLETIRMDPRLYDMPLAIYHQASFGEIFYGQGLGSTVFKGGSADTVVESGFFTMLLKGGIVYIILWFSIFLHIFKDFFFNKGDINSVLFKCLSIMFIICSVISPFFIPYPSSGYQMFWLGKSISKN